MASNLLIGYPVIPHAATSMSLLLDSGSTYTGGAATGFPETNLFGGNRTDRFRMTNPYTNLLLRFNLDSPLTSDFLYVGNADILRNNGATRILLTQNDLGIYGSSTIVLDVNPLSSETFYGPGGQDMIKTLTETAETTKWWVNIIGASTTYYPFSKLFFGKAFDIGRDPDEDGGFVARRVRPTGARRLAAYQFDVTWTGVTYAKAVEFYTTFVKRRRFLPVVLFTSTYHDLMFGHRVVYCRMTSAKMPPKIAGYNNISATFEEIV